VAINAKVEEGNLDPKLTSWTALFDLPVSLAVIYPKIRVDLSSTGITSESLNTHGSLELPTYTYIKHDLYDLYRDVSLNIENHIFYL
jgi:hypothetical protein